MTIFTPAATANIPYSRRRICDGVDNARNLLSGGWTAHPAGLTSVQLHSLPTSLTPGNPEAIPDPIGLAKVDLVGRSSIESMMGRLGVVLVDVEIDELFELRKAVE